MNPEKQDSTMQDEISTLPGDQPEAHPLAGIAVMVDDQLIL